MVGTIEALEQQSADRANREAGFTVIEVVIAATILATAIMTAGLTVLMGMRSQDESEEGSAALRAVRDLCAEIQERANEDQDLTAFEGIGSIFASYDGLTRAVPDLPNGTISVTVYANETTVPNDLGGPQDLNFDGDTNDNLANQSNGSDLQLVPVEITVSYTDVRGTITQTFHRRFSQSTE